VFGKPRENTNCGRCSVRAGIRPFLEFGKL
jgi:hypothetical protein